MKPRGDEAKRATEQARRELVRWISRNPDHRWRKLDSPAVMQTLPNPLERERMPCVMGGPVLVLGPKVHEVIRAARAWWQRTGRFMAGTDVQKQLSVEQGGVPSGILRGLPWDELDRNECISVVWCWYQSIGVPQLVKGEDPVKAEFVLDAANRAPGGLRVVAERIEA